MASVAARLTGCLVVVAALAASAAQLRPVLIYHLTLVPDLEDRGIADSIDSPTIDRFDAVPADWPRLAVANFELRAPIVEASGEPDACRACGDGCRLRLASGTLGIFDDVPIETLLDAFDRFAPSGADIGPWRSRTRNWATLEALAARSMNPGLPESFRFRAPDSQGIVTVHSGPRGERFVIYSFGRLGTPTRVIGLSHVSRDTLHRVLGSLVIADDGDHGWPGVDREDPAANCSSGSGGRPVAMGTS